MSAGPPPKKPPAKPVAAPPPPPPAPPKAADQIEKGVARTAMDKVGSKVGAPPSGQAPDKSYEVHAPPPDLPDHHGIKDAERLKVVFSATQQQAERQWLDKLQA